MYYNQALA